MSKSTQIVSETSSSQIYLLFTSQTADDLSKGIFYSWGTNTEGAKQMNTTTTLPMTVKVSQNSKLDALLVKLSPATPWGERQIAARKLGSMRDSRALPVLLSTLLTDPFWMVRTAIIQALEMINDPAAIPTLKEVAHNDKFQVVRSYAAKAIERI